VIVGAVTVRAGKTAMTGLVWAVLGLVAIVGLAACGGASLSSAPKIEITAARTPLPASPDVGAVYLTIKNDSSQPDVLLSATSDVSTDTMLHNDVTSGISESMVPSGPVTIASGKTLVLQPGGYHLMLMNINRHLAVGNTIHVTLDFKRAGQIAVTVPVVSIVAGAADNGSMSGMKMP